MYVILVLEFINKVQEEILIYVLKNHLVFSILKCLLNSIW